MSNRYKTGDKATQLSSLKKGYGSLNNDQIVIKQAASHYWDLRLPVATLAMKTSPDSF